MQKTRFSEGKLAKKFFRHGMFTTCLCAMTCVSPALRRRPGLVCLHLLKMPLQEGREFLCVVPTLGGLPQCPVILVNFMRTFLSSHVSACLPQESLFNNFYGCSSDHVTLRGPTPFFTNFDHNYHFLFS